MKVLKVVDYTKPYKGSDGKTRPNTNYYLIETVNGKDIAIAIRPSFGNGRAALDILCETRIVKNEETEGAK